MKFEEKIAKEYFEFKNYNPIEFEPIGNTPPDFLLNKVFAVEVRRLNKFHIGKPLEKTDFNVIPKIEKFIKSYKSDFLFENTSIVSIHYSRPIKLDKITKLKILNALKSYSKNKDLKNEYFINDNLQIQFFEHTEKWATQFETCVFVDLDRGGLVFKDICDSLKIIIEEKEKKVQKFKHLYQDWWLVLIDFVGYGVSNEMLDRIRKEIGENLIFKKIIFISPTDSKNGKEINYN